MYIFALLAKGDTEIIANMLTHSTFNDPVQLPHQLTHPYFSPPKAIQFMLVGGFVFG